MILSGSGSDGTLGLKAIKAEGGVTFAQEPKTAAWPAMPASAIAAGAADFILPSAAIAAELMRIGRHPYVRLNGAADAGGSSATALENIYALLHSATGVDFRLYAAHRQPPRRAQDGAPENAVRRRVRALPEAASRKTRVLADDLLIHVTGFFRDPECFKPCESWCSRS